MDFILPIAILIMSVVIHEVSHGYAAFLLGDPTAKYAGRLTLNPIKHLDPWGSVFIPLFLAISQAGILFGWAKPVPYNPYNLKNQKYGPAIVGAAGPLSNLALALFAGVTMRAFFVAGIFEGFVLQVLATIIFINILLMVFNFLPIPPLDGSKLLYAILPVSEHTKMTLDRYGFVILIAFIFLFGSIIQNIVIFVLQWFAKIIVGVSLVDFLQF
ncbi:MAG: site-2 protease family protein [Patescibacteria group bacterium]|nr:site-2 protease family protein [Patescibacteria group bacterium]